MMDAWKERLATQVKLASFMFMSHVVADLV